MSAYGPNKFGKGAISIRPIWKRCKNLGYWRQKVLCCQQRFRTDYNGITTESMIKITIFRIMIHIAITSRINII